MTSINPIYNINYAQAPAFKAKGVNNNEPSATVPISQSNLAFKGTEALRAYNYNLVNKDTDFDIPELQPICPLEDMDKIKGDKIYNSAGQLMCIIDKNNDCKKIYTPSSEFNGIFDIKVYRQDKLIKQQNFYKSIDGNIYLSIINLNENDDIDCCMMYKFNNGYLKKWTKEKHTQNGVYSYNYEKEEYEAYSNKLKKLYDKNLNLKQIIDFTKGEQNTRINYWNDNAISTETRIYENKNIKEQGLNPFVDKDLIPAEYYEIGNTNNIQGKKYYYSNGVIEKIVTPENKTYHYDLDGKFESIKFDNKEVSLFGKNSIVIEEKVNNDTTKITHFDDKQPSCVKFINDEKYKNISWNKDNTIDYQQCDDGYSVLQKTYDKDKNLIKQMVWYHDDNY